MYLYPHFTQGFEVSIPYKQAPDTEDRHFHPRVLEIPMSKNAIFKHPRFFALHNIVFL